MRRLKIVGGIPTHARTSAPVVAERMLEVCDKVLIVAQCTELEIPDSRILVEYRDTPSQLAARNDILDFAEAENADWVLVSDDDLYFKPELLRQLVHETDKPYLGALCTESSLYWYFNRDTIATIGDITTPCNWLLRPHPSQVWLMRMETVREIGKLALEAMQDCEWGLRAWTHGWASARLHMEKNMVHQSFIGRMKKTAEAGGQTPEMRAKFMPISIDYMVKRYKDVSGPNHVLSVMRLQPDNPSRTHITRFNWAQMIENLHNRWGDIGYREHNAGRLKRKA